MSLRPLLVAAALLGACGPTSSPPPRRSAMIELRDLLADHWEETMRRSPEWATTLGDHRYDDRLGDPSAAAIAEDRAARRRYLERARAIDAAALAEPERVTLAL